MSANLSIWNMHAKYQLIRAIHLARAMNVVRNSPQHLIIGGVSMIYRAQRYCRYYHVIIMLATSLSSSGSSPESKDKPISSSGRRSTGGDAPVLAALDIWGGVDVGDVVSRSSAAGLFAKLRNLFAFDDLRFRVAFGVGRRHHLHFLPSVDTVRRRRSGAVDNYAAAAATAAATVGGVRHCECGFVARSEEGKALR